MASPFPLGTNMPGFPLTDDDKGWALANALMTAGGNILSAAGPSRNPVGFGQAVGPGLASFMGSYQQSLGNATAEKLKALQLQQAQQKVTQEARRQQSIDSILAPQAAPFDPMAEQAGLTPQAPTRPRLKSLADEFGVSEDQMEFYLQNGDLAELLKAKMAATGKEQPGAGTQRVPNKNSSTGWVWAAGAAAGQEAPPPEGTSPRRETRTLALDDKRVQDQESRDFGQTWVNVGAPYSRRSDEGMVVSMPDGKGGSIPVLVRGTMEAVNQAITGMTQSSQAKVQDALVGLGGTRQQLTDIISRFKPEYQQIGTRAGMAWTALKDRVGDLSDNERVGLDEFTQFRASAAQLFSNTLKELSGAAVTPAEMKRAEAWLINSGTGIFDGDSPTEFKAKMDRFAEFTDKAIARLHYVSKHGMSIEKIDLDEMPTIIRRRGNELESIFADRGLEGEGLIAAVRQQITREFGLVNK